jgi:hypothetical protein
LTVDGNGSGTGNGSVKYDVHSNPGPGRSAALTIGGQTFTVDQASGCTYQVSPTTFNNVPALGATRTVNVSAGGTCPWTSTSHVSWITITAGASDTGNGPVTLSIAANVVGTRSGTVTVAGQTVTVNQLGVIAPEPDLAARVVDQPLKSGDPDRVQDTDDRSAHDERHHRRQQVLTEGEEQRQARN